MEDEGSITVLSDLYNSFSIGNIVKSRNLLWVGHIYQTWEIRNAYRIFGGKLIGKRQTKRLRRWNDNITTDLRETG